ncbi:MAG: AbrB family transcriptional regulator [Rhodobacteraceae bacterium]|nr:AbrB family transcriptional regulator [Paracoccaceae bacterium]
MRTLIETNLVVQTLVTLALGAIGAGIGQVIGLPLYPITGPALFISALSLAGLPLGLAIPFRNLAFLVVGVGIGAGMNAEARAAMLHWPFAFAALAGLLLLILVVNRWLLETLFGFERRAALLAASPGHLSFVVAMSSAIDADVARISVIQTVRVLILSVLVPFALGALGADVGAPMPQAAQVMGWGAMAVLMLLGAGLGPVLKRVKVPAHFLIAGLLVSASSHFFDLTPGAIHPGIALAGFTAIGTLIGTRFRGITLADLRRALLAALSATAVTLGLTVGIAAPVAGLLGMPAAHVVVAFAPGGLETMIAMGAILGADAGFVAACHLGRLLFLPVLLPMMLGRGSKPA